VPGTSNLHPPPRRTLVCVNLDRALELARSGREQAERDLLEELRIPSVSTLPERRADVRRNCDWLAERLRSLGFAVSVTEMAEGPHPVLQADWRGPGDAAPTVTVYGHYDVQPADPVDEWLTPPFEPVVKDGFVYARGSGDNKGNHMAALKAAEHGIAAGLPVNLRFLLEGEEEIGGPSLPAYLHANAERLRSDCSLIWDGGFETGAHPSLITGLRGMLYLELEASGPAIDLHSGLYGGVAPNPCNTLARILGELKGRDGVITIPGFYDDVRPPTEEEAAGWDRSDGYARSVLGLMQARAMEGEAGYAPVERQWARPTLDVNGFVGGFTGEGAKTVIPARASAKVSMRLVPDQDPDKIERSARAYVEELATPGVEVRVRVHSSARPVLLDWRSRATRTLRDAFDASFEEPSIYVRSGGSIPVTLDFQREVGGEVVCSGIVQPGSGAHSPNEHLSLDNYHRGTETLLRFLFGLA
jgi:acetylornithine deacetylase/succinyl-diaminopimelate desuccinylase-like protein